MSQIKEAFNKAFEQASTKERVILGSMLNNIAARDIEYSPASGYDRWDCKFTDKEGKTYVLDVKCRNVSSTAFNETLIETSKINALKQIAKEEGRRPLLVITFTDNVAYVIDLMNDSVRECKQRTMACNATTAVKTQKIDKQVTLIPLKYGKRVQISN